MTQESYAEQLLVIFMMIIFRRQIPWNERRARRLNIKYWYENDDQER